MLVTFVIAPLLQQFVPLLYLCKMIHPYSIYSICQVILALATNRPHVPYRASKLTHVLKRCLGGNCRTLVLAHVWPLLEHVEETMSTCRLAQHFRQVNNVGVAVSNLKSGNMEVERLRRCVPHGDGQGGLCAVHSIRLILN